MRNAAGRLTKIEAWARTRIDLGIDRYEQYVPTILTPAELEVWDDQSRYVWWLGGDRVSWEDYTPETLPQAWIELYARLLTDPKLRQFYAVLNRFVWGASYPAMRPWLEELDTAYIAHDWARVRSLYWTNYHQWHQWRTLSHKAS